MQFESNFVQSLPGDPSSNPQSRLVQGACYSIVSPTPAPSPRLISYSRGLANELGISASWLEGAEAAEVLGGNKLLAGMVPYAMCYGGHQFGNWAGQLGDGRAINLGEWIAPDGASWTWQLKGAGRTPYSRFGDGLAVLRSSLREYLCSEAMHGLGIPTTRALSLVETGAQVTRDMFYDGNPRKEPGAVVCRVAPNFIRFGNFEILAARNELDLLRQLVDFTILNYFPGLGTPSLEVYEEWFREVCVRTAQLMCEWMRVGFVHGVMNTDNMSILGLTIDYGPYGWIDAYDSNWTPNTTDAEGRRYAFGNQPQIGQWNVVQLANALYPLIGEVEPLQRGLDTYVETVGTKYLSMQSSKLGLFTEEPEVPDDDQHSSRSERTRKCIEALEKCFSSTEVDMTIFYRSLGNLSDEWTKERELSPEHVRREFVDVVGNAFYAQDVFEQQRGGSGSSMLPFWDWIEQYRSLLMENRIPQSIRSERMNRVNPKYVLRNYLAQQAIQAAENGDASELEQLMLLLASPYDEQPQYESKYFAKRPDWAKNAPGCSTLSCSS